MSQSRSRDNSRERNEERAKSIRDDERISRLRDSEMSNNQSDKIREKFDDIKRKNLNEMKMNKDLEKRNSLEERKRIIWDNSERERKDAILRKTIEKDVKLDAKRNAQRNSSCFVFGSSTPRSINLDNVTTLGPLSFRQYQQPSMLSSTPTSVYESNGDDCVRRRPHSMILSTENTGQNLMTQSLVLLPTSGRRRHPELMPAIPKEKDFLSSLSKDLNDVQKKNTGPKRAISMTRLDQLAKPRQRYLEEALKARNAGNYSSNHLNNGSSNSNCMVRSMYNLPTRPLSTTPRAPTATTMRKGMSTSMTQLNDKNYISSSNNNDSCNNSISSNSKYRKHRTSANIRKYSSNTRHVDDFSNAINSHFNEHTKQISRSLVHLNIEKPTQTPKETRTSKLRALKQASFSADCPASKDGQLSSLSRPISSMSGASEVSTPSTSVVMRPKTARKPRPVSIAACAGSRQTDITPVRESRIDEKKQTPIPAQRPNRARSAGSSSSKRVPLTSTDGNNTANNTPKPPPPRKPAHVKAAAAARKTAKQQQSPPAEEKRMENESYEKPIVNPLDEPNEELVKLNDEIENNALIALNDDNNDDDEKKVETQESNNSVPIELENNSIVNQNEANENVNENNLIQAEHKDSNNNKNNDTAADDNDDVTPALTNSISNISVNGSDENQLNANENTSSSKKEMSVDEYKRLLAEKRKQAREQAEREAEQERLRIEQIKREEEERERLFEEESRRLAEEHRRIEEEKLRKAIEEQQLREEEERKRKELELKQKLEKEEQEAKAREEAERARIELEERLRKDEEERLLRKKRVEAIMIRTRKGKETSPNSEGSRSPDLNSNDSPAKGVLVNHKIFVEN